MEIIYNDLGFKNTKTTAATLTRLAINNFRIWGNISYLIKRGLHLFFLRENIKHS
jgi:hypothetical protein